ncbi:flagellar biosynthesis anti-sigma factor FlgM [Kosakonia sp. BYX6]|uniref:Negative regulator of flagellin synthesis n=1 Tax=Kosakonia calanthes TaxID=3139408 RepID=A0ABZ3B9N3_9ENTR
MNIERTSQARAIQSTTAQPQGEPKAKTDEMGNTVKKDGQPNGTQVKLSQLTQQFKTDSSRDIDTDRVAEIKAKMDAGELTLDSDKIASALVRDIFLFS